MRTMKLAAAGLVLTVASMAAHAEIVIGVSISATGPGSSLGVPVRNALQLLPRSIAGERVRLVSYDDASDPTNGARMLRKFATEDRVDVVIGSSTVPVAGAQAVAASESQVLFIALCPIAINPAKQPYVFAIPQPVQLMVEAVAQHMQDARIRKVGYIGFTDAWGDLNLKGLAQAGGDRGISIVATERYARNDISVTAQVLKVMAANPDAIFVGGSGTPGALPQIALLERGYKGPVYHTHGVVNQDFIRVGGKAVEGVIAPTGAVVVADQLPDGHPLKKAGVEFLGAYEGKYGAGSRNAFAAYAFDAYSVVSAAVPAALKKASPGTPEFRKALRDAIESVREVAGTHAVYTMSPTDHNGVDRRGRVLVHVDKGEWRLMK